MLAVVLLAGGTAQAQSVVCRLTNCDDGNPCTIDGCRGLGVCVHEPVRCDDACAAGTCLHVPIDSRCLPPGECATAACAPHEAAADGAGCLPGTAVPEGDECAEDGMPCTDDVCREHSCVHAAVPDVATCEPVTKAFRLTLVLVSQARAIAASVSGLTPESNQVAARTLDRLAQLELTLRDTARTLAGKSPLLPAAHPGDGFDRTAGQLRAIAAAGQLADVPGVLREVLFNLRRLAPSPDPELLATTVERTRTLRRGVRRLKVELRRLRRVQQTFAP